MHKIYLFLYCALISSVVMALDVSYVLEPYSEDKIKESYKKFLNRMNSNTSEVKPEKMAIIQECRNLKPQLSSPVLYVDYLRKRSEATKKILQDSQKLLLEGQTSRAEEVNKGRNKLLRYAQKIEAALHGRHCGGIDPNRQATPEEASIMLGGATTAGRIIAYKVLNEKRSVKEAFSDLTHNLFKESGPAEKTEVPSRTRIHLNIVYSFILKSAISPVMQDYVRKGSKLTWGNCVITNDTELNNYVMKALPYKDLMPNWLLNSEELRSQKAYARVMMDLYPDCLKFPGIADDSLVKDFIDAGLPKEIEQIVIEKGRWVKGSTIALLKKQLESAWEVTLNEAELDGDVFVEMLNSLFNNKDLKKLNLSHCKINVPKDKTFPTLTIKPADVSIQTLRLEGVEGLWKNLIDQLAECVVQGIPILKEIKFPKGYGETLDATIKERNKRHFAVKN